MNIRKRKASQSISIEIDWKEVSRARELIDETLENADIGVYDALTALCVTSIEIAYSYKINKQQLLSNISGLWEKLEYQVNKES
jgi:hypothetical protein